MITDLTILFTLFSAVFCLFLLLQLNFSYDALLHFIIVVLAKVVFELPDNFTYTLPFSIIYFLDFDC